MKKSWMRFKCFFSAIIVMCLFLAEMPASTVYGAEVNVTASASVGTSSIYIDQTADVNLTVKGVSGTSGTVPTDVVLILDQSGSMYGEKISALKTAATNFVNKIDYSIHRVGLVSFETSINNEIGFTTDKDLLVNTISTITSLGQTYVGPAIQSAISMLKDSQRDGAKPVIVLVTDGAASDESATRAAAAEAEANGFIFYTIALFEDESQASVAGTNEYRANELLKDMATTAVHHHFVGAAGLDSVYSKIASDIGVENPYNVVITQTIADEFEYVEGSADDNIPEPTISGQTLTWSMLELKGSALQLSYQVKPKSGVEPGTYNVVKESNVTFETYAGEEKTIEIASPTITIKEIPDVVVSAMKPDTGIVGEATAVTVTASGLYYGSGFKVTVGGKEALITGKRTSNVVFTVPTDLAVGTYDVIIYNGDGSKSVTAGQYTYTPEPVLTVTSITPTSGLEGEKTAVYVEATNMNYDDGFKVYVGSEEADVAVKQTAKFKFWTPTTLTAGTYDITVYNGTGREPVVIGQYTYTAVEEDKLEVTGIDPVTGEEGVATAVTVTAKNMNYDDEFKVYVGGEEAEVTLRQLSKFRFKVPTTLSAGSYDIVVYNGTGSTALTIGQYTYTQATTADDGLKVTAIDVTSGEEGVATAVTVTATNMNYDDGFKVYVGGEEAEVTLRQLSKFRFKVPTTLSAGSYDIVVYNGTGSTALTIGQYTYTQAAAADELEVSAIDVTSGEEGVATAVTVTAKNMNYDDGFKVYVGGEEAEVTLTQLSKFRFKVPTTLSAGSYDIVVYNGTGSTALTIGQYTYTQAAAADELEVSAIDVTSGEEGVATAVTVTAKNMNYDDGFKVYVGGEEAEVTLTQLSKFRFKVPTTLSAGSYDIVVYNGTGSTALTIGQYTYTAVLDEYLITVTDISATSGAVGSGVTVTVTAKGMKYYDGDGLKVYVGGVEATIKLRQTTKFRFVTPTSLSAGTYDIVVYNGGSSVGQKIGTYTYN